MSSDPKPADISNLPIFADPVEEPPAKPATSPARHLLRASSRAAAEEAAAVPEPTVAAPSPAPTARESAEQAEPVVETSELTASAEMWQAVAQIRDAVATDLAEALQARPDMSVQERETLGSQRISEIIRSNVNDTVARQGSAAAWSTAMQTEIRTNVFNALFRLGRLQRLVDIPEVENIDVVGHDNIWLTFAGNVKKRYPYPIAASDEDLEREINFLATRRDGGGRSFTQARPRLRLDLPGGARLQATAKPVGHRTILSLRIHRHIHITLPELVELGTLSVPAAHFLRASVEAGLAIITNGFAASGKTTLLRALADCIPEHEVIITIEGERELYLHERPNHPLVKSFEARPGEGEKGADGRRPGEETTQDLLEDALRHNAQRIIVGEVLGPEMEAMLQAMQAGLGSMSTIHSHSPDAAIERLVTLISRTNSNLTYAYRQIAQNIDLIVQMSVITDKVTGKRRRVVSSISEVQQGESTSGGRPVVGELFHFNKRTQQLEVKNLPSPRILERLEEVGYEPPRLAGSYPEEGAA
ncbi:CpaF family protein [Microbacterium paludicola]|uniref:CpaF family protein n=1 Tax=Microbacterium paludicola TaxID=300019 RepID=A0A4Y9FUS0_9MICO|nr:ATPase, T2SS/T4P/T4SS family [Microbacterium paludicola]MBF0816269.1 CpaF family protein [Microbacterium paludicola]TFU33070.1 CpaF family protein [Microbacterium paludicola]